MENNDKNELKLPFYCFLALAAPEKRLRWKLSHSVSVTVSALTMKYTYFGLLKQHQNAEFSNELGALNQKEEQRLVFVRDALVACPNETHASPTRNVRSAERYDEHTVPICGTSQRMMKTLTERKSEDELNTKKQPHTLLNSWSVMIFWTSAGAPLVPCNNTIKQS